MTPKSLRPPSIAPNKYSRLVEIGSGGMGSVFLCLAQGPAGFRKLHVLKVLKPELAADPEFLGMFLDEARLSARINHPNVVQTHEVGFDGSDYFIAMEYLDGQTLHNVMRRSTDKGRPFTRAMSLKVVAEALSGLQHAHKLVDFAGKELNVVHRDVSPQNIFVTYDGTVKLLDFGIAKANDSSLETSTGVIKGKVAYMAPEQFLGKADHRVDIYAVGVMIWQILTSERLWKGLGDVEIYSALSNQGVPKPSEVAKLPVPPALEAICMRALAIDPSDRYQSALDLQQDIETYLDQTGQRVTTRDIGKHVSLLFAERRAEVRRIIERRVQHLGSGRKDSGVPSVDPTVPRLEITTSTSDGPMGSPGSPATASTSEAGDSNVSSAKVGARRRIFITGGLALAAVVAVAVVIEFRREKPVSAMNPAVAGNVVAVAASSSGSVTPMIEVKLRASPPDSKIFVDDAPVPNPAAIRFWRDGATHHVRAESPGFERKDQLVAFDSASADVLLTLERSPVGRWRRPTNDARKLSGGPAGSPSVTIAPPNQPAKDSSAPQDPIPSGKKRSTLDPTDPWMPKP
ncbi:MAG: hypothetical protein NVS3B20_17110 [Polyangiales bacterium]